MPYIPKRKRLPRNKILVCAKNHFSYAWIQGSVQVQNEGESDITSGRHKTVCKNGAIKKGCCNTHMMSTHFRNNLQRIPFDLDSQPLMFNDGASASITNDLWDFMTKPTATMQKVKGTAGSAKATYRGTVKWKIEDNNNIIHTFVIPNTYYIAAAPTRILSPQHFAQQMQDHKPHAEGAGCMTTSMTIVLFWD